MYSKERNCSSPRKPQIAVPNRAQPTPIRRSRLLRPAENLPLREKLHRFGSLGQYIYSSISDDQIRVLVINRGENDDEICVTLETVSFEDPTENFQYEALSYRWGDGKEDCAVFIQQEHTGERRQVNDIVNLQMRRINVKPTLYKALKCLRKCDQECPLWVDALCINQSDESEKMIQVMKMPQIYRKAERVCIWLGSGNEHSTNAMKFIREVVDLRNITHLVADSKYSSEWANLVELLRNDWFGRRWVVQELLYARDATVHYGEEVVHWSDFKDAIDIFHDYFDIIRNKSPEPQNFTRSTLGEIGALRAKSFVEISSNVFRTNAYGDIKSTKGLEVLVLALSALEASDPRDTIYALRSIAKETQLDYEDNTAPPPPKPDYSKNLFEVYKEFFRWVIETSHSLDILFRRWALPERAYVPFGVPYPRLVKLPSWICTVEKSDLRRGTTDLRTQKHGDSFVGLPGRTTYCASSKSQPYIRFGKVTEVGMACRLGIPSFPTPLPIQMISNPSLYAHGLLLGTIQWASDPILDGVIPHKCLEKAGWSSGPIDSIIEAPDQLWRTLVADRGTNGGDMPSWYHRACLYCLVDCTITGQLNTHELLASTEQPEIVKEYLRRVQAVTWNRSFLEVTLLTGVGEMPRRVKDTANLPGLGPPNTKTNDIVAIIYGCSVPCILREHQNEEDEQWYEVIGEAYIHGMMDGDAMIGGFPEWEFRLM